MTADPAPKKNGGARPGAGRKPSPDPAVNYTIRVPRSWLPRLRGFTAAQIREAIKRCIGA